MSRILISQAAVKLNLHREKFNYKVTHFLGHFKKNLTTLFGDKFI